jgi:lipopolysaccharide export system protein LptA
LRSFILIIVTTFVLAVGGLVYFWLQPSRARLGKGLPGPAVVNLDPNDSGSQLGNGKDVWLKKYDQRTGELASEFIAEEYTPQKGGKIAVKNVTAKFYMSDGQILQIHGSSGLFAGDSNPPSAKGVNGAPRAAAPTRGHLQDVTLDILDHDRRPAMTILMNNASFDSDSSTIVTEAYTDAATGQEVPADQVKVTIRSSDTNPNGYDFDGRGLRVAWNERDHRLSKLDVAHGESMVIKNPKGFSQPKSREEASAGEKRVARVSTSAPVTPVISAATAGTRGKRPSLAPNTDPPVYRAIFREGVRIVQNGQPLATADRMNVDFWMRAAGDAGGATTKSTSRPTTRQIVAATQPTSAPTTSATTAPTSRPADESPVYIYWTGPLHVEPYPQAAAPPGESIVTLEGSPVIAKQQSSEIRAAKLIYRTEDGSLRGAGAAGDDVVMTSGDAHAPSTIHTAALEYLARAQPPTAILSGKSYADLPAQADGAKMHAAWTDRCSLRFETLPDGRSGIKQADITGNVAIDHPQIKLNSQRLELTFDVAGRPAANRPAKSSTAPATQTAMSQTNLKQLIASDAVHCEMKDSQGKPQTIDSNSLTLLTEFSPDGKLVPRTVNADGGVHAVDADQDLRAGHLAVTLAPSTRPASTRPASTKPANGSEGFGSNVDLQSLIAHDSVHVIGHKDGTEAFADTMLVDKKDGKATVKFVGQPSARIIQKGSIVTGAVIDLSPDGQQMSVDGAGTMHGSQQESAGATTKPIDVAWTQSLRVDGKKNTVDAVGGVVATSKDADGTVNTARGDRAQLFLIDLPSTQPTTRLSTTTRATTQMATAHKAVRQAVFQDNASVSSILLDNAGLPLRRMNLFAALIQYDLQADGGPGSGRKMTVPVGGRMLVEDYRGPTSKPADGQGDVAGAQGATAFQWAKSLIYDDSTHKAVMQGSVLIDHRDNVQKEDSMRLTGDTVTAELEPAATTKPATRAATGPSEEKFQVRRITAKGNLIVTMKGGELRCDTIVYDPITHLLTARGTEDVDAVFTRNGPAGTQPIRAEEMQWDSKAELPRITKMRAQFRH